MITIDLKERVALVIGGSRGIGGSITLTLCEAGAYTVFTHTGNPAYSDRVSTLLDDIAAAGGKAQEVVLDALDSEGTESLVREIVKERGKVDFLVCNAGANRPMMFADTSDALWKDEVDLNLSTAFYSIRSVLPSMIEQHHGKIVLIGSSAVHDGGGGAVGYASAKAGMTGIMKFLCRQHLKDGILTNIIHPCVVETDLLKSRYGEPEKRESLIAQVPVGRLGRPEDIAGLTAFLFSSWGDFICGQEILVDGGRTHYNK